MIEIKEYLDSDGVSSFSEWFAALDTQSALKVTTYHYKPRQASFPFQGEQNFVSVDSVDSLEFEIHFGYFMRFILTLRIV